MPLAVGEILRSEKWPRSISADDMRVAYEKFKSEYAALMTAGSDNAFGAAIYRTMKTFESKIKPKEQWVLVCDELKRMVAQGRSVKAAIRRNRPRDLGIIERIPLSD